jgi:hypothetical protein
VATSDARAEECLFKVWLGDGSMLPSYESVWILLLKTKECEKSGFGVDFKC